jgi:hypothetical protein
LSPILWQHFDNFLEAAEVIRDAGLYGGRRSGLSKNALNTVAKDISHVSPQALRANAIG